MASGPARLHQLSCSGATIAWAMWSPIANRPWSIETTNQSASITWMMPVCLFLTLRVCWTFKKIKIWSFPTGEGLAYWVTLVKRHSDLAWSRSLGATRPIVAPSIALIQCQRVNTFQLSCRQVTFSMGSTILVRSSVNCHWSELTHGENEPNSGQLGRGWDQTLKPHN